jgi:hypothetical protein
VRLDHLLSREASRIGAPEPPSSCTTQRDERSGPSNVDRIGTLGVRGSRALRMLLSFERPAASPAGVLARSLKTVQFFQCNGYHRVLDAESSA